jgi:hypothetical protein
MTSMKGSTSITSASAGPITRISRLSSRQACSVGIIHSSPTAAWRGRETM